MSIEERYRLSRPCAGSTLSSKRPPRASRPQLGRHAGRILGLTAAELALGTVLAGVQAAAAATGTIDGVDYLATITSSGTFQGAPGDDVIYCGNGPDTIKGLPGDNVICGRGGADRIDAGNADFVDDSCDTVIGVP